MYTNLLSEYELSYCPYLLANTLVKAFVGGEFRGIPSQKKIIIVEYLLLIQKAMILIFSFC